MIELTVLGIGNVLMRDDGVGVRVLERVRQVRDWPDAVEFVDGGAGGLNLINVLEAAERLVVFDSAEMNLAPGEHRVITPRQFGDAPAEHRASMHDAPFSETLALVSRFFHEPELVRVLAIQPKVVDYGRALSDELTAAMDHVTAAGVRLVEQTCGRTKTA
ncbi:MAG: hydrogenase maturation protease [Phycisphaerae bacterium]|nr:hydrogenase maturation protease [Phycisphaerae bacterium]